MASRMFRDDDRARKALDRFARKWVEPDRNGLRRPGVHEIMTTSLAEAFRQGPRGSAWDGSLLAGGPWGFRFDDITFSPMYLWHGELDNNVPIATARAMADALVHCTTTYYPDDGHLSVVVNHRDEIMAALTM